MEKSSSGFFVFTQIARGQEVELENAAVKPSGWRPIGFRVLIEPDDVMSELKKQFGSLELPEQALEREQTAWDRGTLIDWGPTAGEAFGDVRMEDLGVKRGDKVLFNKYAGYQFRDESGRLLRVINDEDLNMVWKDQEV